MFTYLINLNTKYTRIQIDVQQKYIPKYIIKMYTISG